MTKGETWGVVIGLIGVAVAIAAWRLPVAPAMSAQQSSVNGALALTPPPSDRPEPTLPIPKAPVSDFGEWWLEGTPIPDPSLMSSEEAYWRSVELAKGACEPSRQYLKWFPQGAHASQAKKLLSSLNFRTVTRTNIAETDLPQESDTTLGDADFDKNEECAKLSKWNSDLANSSCSGSVAGRNFVGGSASLLSVEIKNNGDSCACSRGIVWGWSCKSSQIWVCKIAEKVQSKIETCTGM